MINLPIAKYIDAEIKDYENNPLINALPSIKSEKEVSNLLFLTPKITDEERRLPSHLRRHVMTAILDKFLYPTAQHIQLEQLISIQIRRSYLNRNIATKDYDNLVNNTNFDDISKSYNQTTNSSFVSSLIGCSGTGKSTAIEAIIKTYPQAIYHPKYQHTQLVWLKIDAPHDGSARSLCVHFFRAVDNALGTSYESTYVKSRSSADLLLGDIARVSAIHSLGILVLDELQHLQVASSGGYDKLLNFFVTMSNVIKVPLLLVGTPKALGMVDREMRSARRLSQIGYIHWERFKLEPKKKGEKDETEWQTFLKKMWKLQWLKKPTPLTEELEQVFKLCTQGIVHLATLLFYLTQVRAVVSGQEAITPNRILQVFNEELKLIHPMINAIHSGRQEEINKFDDLDRLTEKFYNQEAIREKETIESETSSKENELIEMLIKLNLSENTARITVKKVIEQYPDADLHKLMTKILYPDDEGNKPQKLQKKSKQMKLEPKYVDKDIRVLADSDDAYESLKKAGLITDITLFLD